MSRQKSSSRCTITHDSVHVFQFYAAITKLKTPEIKDVVVQVAKGCAVDYPDHTNVALLLSLLHCLYEAQDSSLCELVADQLESKLNLRTTTLSLVECFSLQYFLTLDENMDFVQVGNV